MSIDGIKAKIDEIDTRTWPVRTVNYEHARLVPAKDVVALMAWGQALRTAVEALEHNREYAGAEQVACEALAAIRKELGIGKEAPDA